MIGCELILTSTALKMPCKCCSYYKLFYIKNIMLYTVNHKKRDILFFTITLAKLN